MKENSSLIGARKADLYRYADLQGANLQYADLQDIANNYVIIKCVDKGVSMRSIVTRLVKKWIKK